MRLSLLTRPSSLAMAEVQSSVSPQIPALIITVITVIRAIMAAAGSMANAPIPPHQALRTG